MRALVPQIVLDEAEEAARSARFPLGSAIEFADLELDSRVGALDRLRELRADLVGAGARWLARHIARARARAAQQARRVHGLGRAQPRARLARRDDADDATATSTRGSAAPSRSRSACAPCASASRSPCSSRVDALIGELAPRGGCELVAEFAAPFAIGVAGDVLGLSLDDVARVQEFYEAFAGAMVYDGDPEPQRRADAARAELNAILLAEIERSRARPGQLDHERRRERPGARALRRRDRGAAAGDPVRRDRDRRVDARERRAAAAAAPRRARDPCAPSPASLGNAIEEGMRLIPPVAFIERWSAVPCELGGVALAAGEFLGVSTVAANRDPAVFPDPERFDVRRGNARHHLTLSHGHHHCLGFNLGRMQCQVALTALLDRLPGLEIVHAPEPTGFAFRRPATLELRWQA